ncbi:MAG: hypothetical protein ACYSWU_02170 [Planctomycetota bacterium]|jgi:hypothetical protein
MQGQASYAAAELYKKHNPAAANPATETVDAVAGHYAVIDSLHFGLDSTPAAGVKVNVTFGGTEKWAVYMSNGGVGIGPHNFTFPRGLYTGGLNEDVVVTVADPGGAVTASLAYTYRLLQGPANPAAMVYTDKSVVAATNDAVCTVTADANQFWCLDTIHGGYAGDAGGALKLNVTINAVEVWAVDLGDALSNSGPFEFHFPRGLYSTTKNQAMVVTLAADAAQAAALSITYR